MEPGQESAMKAPAAMKDTAASNFGKRTFPLLERQNTSGGPGSGALNNSAYPQSKICHYAHQN